MSKTFRSNKTVDNADTDLTDGGIIEGTLCYKNGTEGVGKILQSDIDGCLTYITPAVGGETNTASNQGAGSGVFKQKTGPDLEFNSLSGGTGITQSLAADVITFNLDNTAITPATYGDNNSVGQFTVDAQGRLTSASNVDISHDALTDYNADEHINWKNAASAFKTNISDANAFLVEDGAGNDIMRVNTTIPNIRFDGSLIVDHTSASALTIRDNGAVSKFVVDTNQSPAMTFNTGKLQVKVNSTAALDIEDDANISALLVNTVAPRVDIIAPMRYTGDTPINTGLLQSNASGDLTYANLNTINYLSLLNAVDWTSTNTNFNNGSGSITSSGNMNMSGTFTQSSNQSNALRVRKADLTALFQVNTVADQVNITNCLFNVQGSSTMRIGQVGATAPISGYILSATDTNGSLNWITPPAVIDEDNGSATVDYTSSNMTGTINADIKYSKVGKMVNVHVELITWTGSAGTGSVSSNAGVVPVGFRPSSGVAKGVCHALNNNTNQFSSANLSSAGTIVIYGTSSFGGWTGTTTQNARSFDFNFTIA